MRRRNRRGAKRRFQNGGRTHSHRHSHPHRLADHGHDGGIDPSEGSGTKDDVPAMLTAGEFVLTKDAVKGLGNGNQRLGIQKAYNMMNNLERMA